MINKPDKIEMLVFPHLQPEGCKPECYPDTFSDSDEDEDYEMNHDSNVDDSMDEDSMDEDFTGSDEEIVNPRVEINKYMTATQSLVVQGVDGWSTPGVEGYWGMDPRSIVSHIKNSDYIVFGADGVINIKEDKDIMDSIKDYVNDNKSMNFMYIYWMEVKDMPTMRAIYSIEWFGQM